jgi:hypothetical protein
MDLADLTSGTWDEPSRAALAAAYRSACETAAAMRESDFERRLQACRLHRALQWLGWSRSWSPPPEHAHDWLCELERAWRHLSE